MPKQLLSDSTDPTDEGEGEGEENDDSGDFIFIVLLVIGLLTCGVCVYRKLVKKKHKMDYKNAGF